MKKQIILLLFMSSLSWASTCDVSSVLVQIRPGAQWTMTNEDPSTLIWTSTDTIPSSSEIQSGIDACNAEQTPSGQNLKARSDAIGSLLNSTTERDKLIRAVLLTMFDENNNTRQWIQSFKAAVAASTSLADLKTRVAALPAMPDRTVQQAKTAVSNKIDSGTSD